MFEISEQVTTSNLNDTDLRDLSRSIATAKLRAKASIESTKPTLRGHRYLDKTLAPVLLLLADGLCVGLAVWIEEFFAVFVPCGFELFGRDIPVGPTFLENGA